MESPEAVAHAFVEAINRHSPPGIAALMTEDHLFIDSLGNAMQGREKMRSAWVAYFALVPDYRIALSETYRSGDIVVMLGIVGGATRGQAWQTPAALRAEIRVSQVAAWRVYADNEPIRRVLAATQNEPGV